MPPSDANARSPNRRGKILDVAGELFGKHGVHAVTTRQIAQVVGISQPSIYAHFPSIQAIQQEVGARSFALLEQAISASKDDSPEAQLRSAIRGYLHFGLTNPQAYRIAFMLEHRAADEKAGEQDQAAFASLDHPGPRAFGHLSRIVGLNRPDLSQEAIRVRSQCLWSALHGLVSLLLARPHFPWAERETLLDEHGQLACKMVLA